MKSSPLSKKKQLVPKTVNSGVKISSTAPSVNSAISANSGSIKQNQWLDTSTSFDLNHLNLDVPSTLIFYFSGNCLLPLLGDYDIAQSNDEKKQHDRIMYSKFFNGKSARKLQTELEGRCLPIKAMQHFEIDGTTFEPLQDAEGQVPTELMAQGSLLVQKINDLYVLDVDFNFHIPLACSACYNSLIFKEHIKERLILKTTKLIKPDYSAYLKHDEELRSLDEIEEDAIERFLERPNRLRLDWIIVEFIQMFIPSQVYCLKNCNRLELKAFQLSTKRDEGKISKKNPFDKLKDFRIENHPESPGSKGPSSNKKKEPKPASGPGRRK